MLEDQFGVEAKFIKVLYTYIAGISYQLLINFGGKIVTFKKCAKIFVLRQWRPLLRKIVFEYSRLLSHFR